MQSTYALNPSSFGSWIAAQSAPHAASSEKSVRSTRECFALGNGSTNTSAAARQMSVAGPARLTSTHDAGPVNCNDLLAAAPLLTDGDHQPIGIDVLGDPSAKGFLRFLSAGHVPLGHPLVERIEI